MRSIYIALVCLVFSQANASRFEEREPVDFSFGSMAYVETNPESEDVILFVHGNSSYSGIFENQLNDGGLAQRLIAVDLPGHGRSSNATHPELTYSFGGYADAMIEFIESQFKGKRIVLVGWSLGGHIGLEIARKRPELLKGLLITGTPPIDLTPEGMGQGFKMTEIGKFIAKEDLSEDEVEIFAAAGGTTPTDAIRAAVRRTDGRARSMMIADASSGKHASQKSLVEEGLQVPLAIVMGTEDQGINSQYIKELHYGVPPVMLEIACGHDTFHDHADVFNPFLAHFAASCLSE